LGREPDPRRGGRAGGRQPRGRPGRRVSATGGRRRTMLALVKAAPGPGLQLREVPIPEIGINDVLIRVRKTGICGTDLHIEAWDAWAARTVRPPLIVGHEFVGEIVEVGANVTDFHPGEL